MSEMQHALDRGGMDLHYQPKYDLRTTAGSVGVEALVRWSHPQPRTGWRPTCLPAAGRRDRPRRRAD
jgi:EAL domain-containing protein (putative c-di-GMP-specific phosphodiesterase class I)